MFNEKLLIFVKISEIFKFKESVNEINHKNSRTPYIVFNFL